MNSILYVGMDVYKENYTLCCYSFDRDKVEYERSEARQGYRSGHYDRNLTTRPPATSRSICRGSRACPSRPPSSSGIAAGKAA